MICELFFNMFVYVTLILAILWGTRLYAVINHAKATASRLKSLIDGTGPYERSLGIV
jgi:hypothetical protein